MENSVHVNDHEEVPISSEATYLSPFTYRETSTPEAPFAINWELSLPFPGPVS